MTRLFCMNMSQNCMNYIHFTQESVVGTYQWKGDIDLANIVLIGLAEDLPEKEEKYELHRLLGALLSAKLDVDEKFDIIIQTKLSYIKAVLKNRY